MRPYSDKIALIKNSRGVYSLDTVMGCDGGTKQGRFGCFDDCYAARAAHRYGYDFSVPVLRKFVDEDHVKKIIKAINKADSGFIRIGTSGDPSEDWHHTLSVIDQIREIEKRIVIITRHWKPIPDEMLLQLGKYRVVVNTTVSALDSDELSDNCLHQYERLKPFCKSVLRVVTCDFNTMHPAGYVMAAKQDKLVAIDQNYIDTVFRPSKSSKYIAANAINYREKRFLKGKSLISKANKETYIGHCRNCKEQCGA